MSVEWIVVETLAILIENFMLIYYLNSRFDSKYATLLPQVLTCFTSVGWGIIATFGEFPFVLYNLVWGIILFIFLYFAKWGTIVQKAFALITIWVLYMGSAMVGAGLASLLTDTTLEQTLIYEDYSRLLAIISVKTIQTIMLYMLAKKRRNSHSLQKIPTLVLGFVAVVETFCFVLVYNNISEFNEERNQFLLFISISLLFIMVVILLMYELFIREEIRNIELSTKLQRMELESHFFKEIDAMYADMRIWRHEYRNNLTALRVLAEQGDAPKILAYIDSITREPERNLVTLQTGNLILDAVVSSKLWLAKSRNIEVSLQAIYPGNNRIEDNDLCSITGNLLDNAIEACERMMDADDKKFIDLSILVKGKNLIISISNSFNNKLRKKGERYLTLKDGSFHGMGIPHVDSIVSKYQGNVIREAKHGVFETHIMLPLLSPDGEDNS